MSDAAEDTARKKLAHVIAIGISPSDKEEKEEGGEEKEGPDAGLVAAMDDFRAALKADDSQAMAEAFENAKALCKY